MADFARRDGRLCCGTGRFRQAGGHIRCNKTWRHDVGGDIAGSILFGSAFRQADQPRLAGCVVGLTRVAVQTDNAADADDAPY